MQNDVIQELKELPSWFTKHPLTEKIVKENQQQINERRKLALVILARVKNDQGKALPLLIEAISKAEEALAAARAKVKEAEKVLTWAAHKKLTASIESNAGIQAQENTLRETAAPIIDETIKLFNDKLAALRKPEAIRGQDFPGPVDLYTEKRKPYSFSNLEALREALSYLQAGIAELEALKLADIDGAALQRQIDELKKGIPNSEEVKLYQQQE